MRSGISRLNTRSIRSAKESRFSSGSPITRSEKSRISSDTKKKSKSESNDFDRVARTRSKSMAVSRRKGVKSSSFTVHRLIYFIRSYVSRFDQYLWNSSGFRKGLIVLLMTVLFTCLIFKMIYNKNVGRWPSPSYILFILSFPFLYWLSLIFNRRVKFHESNTNASEPSNNFWKSVKEHLLKLFTYDTIVNISHAIHRHYDKVTPIIQSFGVLCLAACLLIEAAFNNVTAIIFVFSVIIALSSMHDLSKIYLGGILTGAITTFIFSFAILRTNFGDSVIRNWYSLMRYVNNQFFAIIKRSTDMSTLSVIENAPELMQTFYDPFFVSVAAAIYQLGIVQFLILLFGHFGTYFFKVATVVAGCLICSFFFDFAGIILWMSPFLSLATDHELFLIIVSASTTMMLPLSFQLSHRYGLSHPIISAFGPINACVALLVCRILSPDDRSAYLHFHFENLTQRNESRFLESISSAASTSAKYVLAYVGGVVLFTGIERLIDNAFKQISDYWCKGTSDSDSWRSFYFDYIAYYILIPLLYVMGISEKDMFIASKIIRTNLLTFKTTSVDELMNYVATRWITDCWINKFDNLVYFGNGYTYLRDGTEQGMAFFLKRGVLDKESEIALLHSLVNFANIGSIILYCALLTMIMPQKIVSIRFLLTRIVLSTWGSILLANGFLRTFVKTDRHGLMCSPDEGKLNVCISILDEVKNMSIFNGSINVVNPNVHRICYIAMKKMSIFPDERMEMF